MISIEFGGSRTLRIVYAEGRVREVVNRAKINQASKHVAHGTDGGGPHVQRL